MLYNIFTINFFSIKTLGPSNVPSLEMHKEILKKLDNLIIEGK